MASGTRTRDALAPVRALILPLLLIWGTIGLVYAVTWIRALAAVFGNTVYAAGSALTFFMLGLALGSRLFGGPADRSANPVRLFGILQLLTAIYAALLPTILQQADALQLWLHRTLDPGFTAPNLAGFLLPAGVLAIPTILMGAVPPVLSRLWASTADTSGPPARIGQSVGLLSAVATLGAAAGSLLPGYVLIRTLGVSNTIYLTAAVNLGLGLLALLLSLRVRAWYEHERLLTSSLRRRLRDLAPAVAGAAESPHPGKPERGRHIVPIAALGIGFCAMALEVLWSRVLIDVFPASTHSFASLLGCLMLGIALGSTVAGAFIVGRVKRPVFALGIMVFLMGLVVLCSMALPGHMRQIHARVLGWLAGVGSPAVVAGLADMGDVLVVLLAPAILAGVALPIAAKAYVPNWRGVGRQVGRLCGWGLIGCVLGIWVVSSVMAPILGLRPSFLIVVAVQFLLVFLLSAASELRRISAAVPATLALIAALGATALAVSGNVPFLMTNTGDGNAIVTAADTVAVVGADLPLRTAQKLSAYVPLLLHPDPQKVLQIGGGSGPCATGLALGVRQYSLAEVSLLAPDVDQALLQANLSLSDDPRVRQINVDGRTFVRLTDETFDVIVSDAAFSATSPGAALYSCDQFLRCRQHLGEQGVLACRLPLDVPPESFRILVRSFQMVFPNGCLWMGVNGVSREALLVGTVKPMQIDLQRIRVLMERPDVAADFAQIGIQTPYDLVDCFVVGPAGLAKIAGTVPLNTDDQPRLEFATAPTANPDDSRLAIFNWIVENHTPVSRYVTNIGSTYQEQQRAGETLQQYYEGTHHALLGLIGLLQADTEVMNKEFSLARQTNPSDRDVAACLDGLRIECGRMAFAAAQAEMRDPASLPPDLHRRLAECYMLLQQYEPAAEQYAAFVHQVPSDSTAWNSLGVCYENLDRPREALHAFENSIYYQKDSWTAYYNLARTYHKLNDLPAATRALEKALSLSSEPQRILTYAMLAQVCLSQKQYGLALEHLDKAQAMVKGNSSLRQYLSEIRDSVLQNQTALP